MRFTADVPSFLAGIAVTIGITNLSHADWAGMVRGIDPVTLAVPAAIFGVLVAAVALKWQEPGRGRKVVEGVGYKSLPPSLLPDEWLKAITTWAPLGTETRDIATIGFTAQVEHEVEDDLYIMLMAAFRYRAAKPRDFDWSIDELERGLASGVLDVEGFLAGCQERNPEIPAGRDFWRKPARPVLTLVRELESVRAITGPLPSAMFVSLKRRDRALWYALNSLGRKAHHVEAAGVFSHLEAERLAGQPIERPAVEAAVDGLMEWCEKSDMAANPEQQPQ